MAYVMGIDLGFGNIKLADRHGTQVHASHLSLATGERFVDAISEGKSKRADRVEFGGNAFYTGQYAVYEGMPVGNLGYDRLTGSLEIKALLYSALSNHMAENSRIRVPIDAVVGLPFAMLKEEQAKTTQQVMDDWMIGDHAWVWNGEAQKVNFSSVTIKPQAGGALFDYILNMDGTPSANASIIRSEVGIVSIGYNTIELMVLDNGNQVAKWAGSEPQGVRRLLELANKKKLYTYAELDSLMRDGRLNGDLTSAIKLWSEVVSTTINDTWGANWKRFGKIIVVGGGASILADHLRGYFSGKSVMPDRPIESIALGLYKRGLYDAKKKG